MNSAQVVEPIAQHLPPRTVPDNKCRFLEKVSLGIAADGDDIDFAACDSADFQAPADRDSRLAGPRYVCCVRHEQPEPGRPPSSRESPDPSHCRAAAYR